MERGLALTRAVALWLGFAAFLIVRYVAGCGAPADTAEGLACGTGVSCACWYEVQYHTVPQCAPESDFACAPDSCVLAERVTLTCHNGLRVTLDVTEGLAYVTAADGCTETLPVSVRYGSGS